MTPRRVVVLLGGSSAERDVSLVSGARIAAALRGRGHLVNCVDPATGPLSRGDEAAILESGIAIAPPTREALLALSSSGGGFDPVHLTGPAVRGAEVAFLALHGGAGEDGRVQAVLDLLGLPYTGSTHVASALAMDKDVSKILFRAAGVPTAEWLMAPVTEADVRARIGLPLIVKPSKQGSTVGLSLVRAWEELPGAIAEAMLHDDEVMVERFIAGRELTVAVIGETALPVGEIISRHEIYDYECKYTAGMAREEFPANLEEAQTATVQRHALAAFRALKLRGHARIDFRLGEDGVFYCLEANTLPGMTALSLVPQAAAAAGIAFDALCEQIVLSAIEERAA